MQNEDEAKKILIGQRHQGKKTLIDQPAVGYTFRNIIAAHPDGVQKRKWLNFVLVMGYRPR